MSTERDKGRDLEERVAAILRGHDYKVATNVVLKGRSGARHELDVVGDTFDGLTSFRVVVECKAWARPIDKDIVYRLASELADLGAARGIIASLSSWTPQAVQAANQAHIELWGPDELKARLRHVALSETQLPHVQDSAQGLAFVVESEVARSQIERIAKGKRRVGREEITWFGPLWLPTWSLRLGLVRMQGHLRRVPRATRVWNSYEALTGRCTRTYLVPPLLVDVDLACGHLPPVLNVAKVEDRLTTSWTRWRQVTSGEAKKQHAAMLAKMGVPVPVYGLA
ncbi:MAG: restriction endonuclease, partial [Acidimicrobiales bacterium]